MAIAFQVPLRTTFVILSEVKDPWLLFPSFVVKVGEATMSNLCRLAGDRPKSNRRSFVAALLRMTNRWDSSKDSEMRLPCL
jgi:hypothetical protein